MPIVIATSTQCNGEVYAVTIESRFFVIWIHSLMLRPLSYEENMTAVQLCTAYDAIIRVCSSIHVRTKFDVKTAHTLIFITVRDVGINNIQPICAAFVDLFNTEVELNAIPLAILANRSLNCDWFIIQQFVQHVCSFYPATPKRNQ